MSTPAPAQRLGPYELIELIGKGGMGEVWRARDTRLDRTVAIKVPKSAFDARFEREARAVAALNHPHICTLHDVGPNYLVMEHVEGEELRGPMSVARAVELGSQILDALDAAHRKGITHRDLKPANILVTKSGIKVLDFGLAKSQATALGSDAPSLLSVEGTIAGTLHYMAPEQLQGRPDVDGRADIFSFGCVLYEMLTGKRAFEGKDAASVIAAVMDRPAPSVAEVAPPALDRVLKKCLEKDRDERWQNARDLKTELQWSVEASAQPKTAAKSPLGWIAAFAAAALVAAGVSFVHFREKPADAPVVRTEIALPEKTSFASNPSLALSPDGRKLVFSAQTSDGRSQLWLKPFDAVKAQPLPGTENGFAPFWSPDSKSVGFFADGSLKRVDVAGGPALTLAPAGGNFNSGAWSTDGTIVFSSFNISPLLKVTARGAQTVAATELKGGARVPTAGPGSCPMGDIFFSGRVWPA